MKYNLIYKEKVRKIDIDFKECNIFKGGIIGK